MLVFVSTAPVLRRIQRGDTHTSRTAVTAHDNGSNRNSATGRHTSTTSLAASQVANLPKADPCYNYFELFPEEVGAVGNVQVSDPEEARLWELVGRPVSAAEAERDGGCVKVTLEGSSSTLYYRIMDSDDVVYGRAAYLRLPTSTVTALDGCVLKEEPSVFTPCCNEAGSVGDDSDDCWAHCSSCVSGSSVRCVYPVQCEAKWESIEK